MSDADGDGNGDVDGHVGCRVDAEGVKVKARGKDGFSINQDII